MLWNAENKSVCVDDSDMHYVSFGYGSRTVVLLPGLSDGLVTVRGKALLLAAPYRDFFKNHRIYIFSRKSKLPLGYTIRDMAADQARAMEKLGITGANVMGVSQGGMIAQFLAADHPEAVGRLVIAVSAPRVNDMIRENAGRWIELAEKGDHKTLMIDTAEKSYSEGYLKKYRRIYPLLGMVGKPASYDRFIANANAILGFDAYGELDRIACPALIIGGSEDKTVGAGAAHELHEKIPGSELYIYEGLGHAAYEEAGDFNERAFGFFGQSG